MFCLHKKLCITSFKFFKYFYSGLKTDAKRMITAFKLVKIIQKDFCHCFAAELKLQEHFPCKKDKTILFCSFYHFPLGFKNPLQIRVSNNTSKCNNTI